MYNAASLCNMTDQMLVCSSALVWRKMTDQMLVCFSILLALHQSAPELLSAVNVGAVAVGVAAEDPRAATRAAVPGPLHVH